MFHLNVPHRILWLNLTRAWTCFRSLAYIFFSQSKDLRAWYYIESFVCPFTLTFEWVKRFWQKLAWTPFHWIPASIRFFSLNEIWSYVVRHNQLLLSSRFFFLFFSSSFFMFKDSKGTSCRLCSLCEISVFVHNKYRNQCRRKIYFVDYNVNLIW